MKSDEAVTVTVVVYQHISNSVTWLGHNETGVW